MAIEGSLSDVSLPDISQLLGMGGKTGCLSLTYKGNFGYVYFQDGRVIYASVVNRTDRLRKYLLGEVCVGANRNVNDIIAAFVSDLISEVMKDDPSIPILERCYD